MVQPQITQQKLHSKLLQIQGLRDAYYVSPGSNMMNYPCVVYEINNIQNNKANNNGYIGKIGYKLLLITKEVDDPILTELLKFEYASFSNYYVSDNLHHYAVTIYY